MNYTKYVLKSNDELTALLADKDNLFVIACNKCFKEFEDTNEPDCGEFVELATAQGKNVVGTTKIDFLCNKVQTERKLADVIPAEAENIIVISCGLGIQTVADLKDIPVFTATNSLNYIGHHGMALTKKTCGACNQCYLNMTGGICPIVDCSKSLINGQCGGAKNGKCEIDPKKDCAWENIYQRLEAQGRQADFKDQPVQVRDYNRVNIKMVKEYVASIRDGRFDAFYGGIHPDERKEFTEHITVKQFPEPETVVIPTTMHVGKPANPIVKAGDTVKVGQLIAEQDGFISCNVHSSVSGTVAAVEPRLHPNRGCDVMSIVIDSDGKNTLDESVKPNKPLEELTPAEIIEIVRDKGITGMGGAGFPTYVKLQPNKPIDTVLINGSECEPLLTADHRVLLEYPDDIVYGLKAIMKAVDAPKGIIVIEDNKPDAIEIMKAKVEGDDSVEIMVARTKYPEGAEKMLIKKALQRKVPSGGLPADVGVVVSNISSVKAISDAIQKGMPLIERVASVTGERMKNPGNYMVKVGTNVQDIIDYCGGTTGTNVTIKMGGVMMGAPLSNTEVPVIKGTNGIIAIDTDSTKEVECIKCGRCADVCPMELTPMNFAKYADEGNAEALLANNIRDCFECRCCMYICSSKIPLIDKIRAGKKLIMEVKK